jgi:hypothetical protein
VPIDAHIRVRLDGTDTVLKPGDFIGRLRTAALRIDDPRISEAHALVSLRGGEVKLLALRGALAVDRQRVNDVTLAPGLAIRLARDCILEVVEVTIPDEALAIRLDDAEPVLLTGSTMSLVLGAAVEVLPRFDPAADAQLWSDGVGWRMAHAGASVLLEPDDRHALGTHTLEVVTVPLAKAGLEATAMRGRVHPPLRIVASYDSVQLHREGADPVVLAGIQARIVSELIAFGGPTSWEVVASEIWKDVPRHTLRRRWDVNLGRLRTRLKDAQLRPDLLNSDGTGNIELILLPDDLVVDRM